MLEPLIVLLAKVALALIGIFLGILALLVITRARRPFPLDGAWEVTGDGWRAGPDRVGWRRAGEQLERDGWAFLGLARHRATAVASWLSPCRRVVANVVGQRGFDAIAMISVDADGRRVWTGNQPVGTLPTSPRGRLLWKATAPELYAAHVAGLGDGVAVLTAETALAAMRAASARQIDALVPTGWVAWADDAKTRVMFTWRGAVASVRADQRLLDLARRARGAAIALPPASMGRPWKTAVIVAGTVLCAGVLTLGWARSSRVCRARAATHGWIAVAAPVTAGDPELAWAGQQVTAGELTLSSGDLVVGDAARAGAPLATELRPGTYPVIASMEGSRVRFARLELAPTRPMAWVASGLEVQEPAFTVTSGHAMFRDGATGQTVTYAAPAGAHPVFVGYDEHGEVTAVVVQLVDVAP